MVLILDFFVKAVKHYQYSRSLLYLGPYVMFFANANSNNINS